MADNSVTIALKLDASQFNATLKQAQADLGGFGAGAGRGGKRSGKDDLGLETIAFESKKASNNMTKMNKSMENFVVRFTSMLRGNLSPSNVLNTLKSAQGVVGGMGGGIGGGTGNALAGIEGIGAQGAAAAAASGVGGTIGASLGAIVGLLVGIATVIALIAAGIAVLITSVSAISVAFSPILKILQAIGRVIGAALVPISTVIVQFLKPLIWMLIPFVHLMNAIFRPIRMAIAQFFKGAATLIRSGDIGAIFGGLFAVVMPILTAAATAIGNMLMPLFTQLAAWIAGFLELDMSALKNTLENLLGKQLGDAVSGLINVIYFAISAISGFIAQFVGKKDFDKIFGTGAFNKIAEKNEGFAFGKGIGETVQKLVTIFSGWIAAFTKDPLGTLYSTLVSAITSVISAMKTLAFGTGVPKGLRVGTPPYKPSPIKPKTDTLETVFEESGLIGAINMIVKQFTGIDVAKFWNDLTDYWTSTLKPAFDNIVKSINSFLDTTWNGPKGVAASATSLATSLDSAAAAFALVTGSWITNLALGWIANQFANAKKKTTTVQDAVIAPGGNVVSTSPRDYLFAMQDPSSIANGGGNNFSLTINVEGNVDDKTRKVIIEEVQRVVAYQWRSIAR
jgi:hypothetical protein